MTSSHSLISQIGNRRSSEFPRSAKSGHWLPCVVSSLLFWNTYNGLTTPEVGDIRLYETQCRLFFDHTMIHHGTY